MEDIQFRWQHTGNSHSDHADQGKIVVLAEIYSDKDRMEGSTLPICDLAPGQQNEKWADLIVEGLKKVAPRR